MLIDTFVFLSLGPRNRSTSGRKDGTIRGLGPGVAHPQIHGCLSSVGNNVAHLYFGQTEAGMIEELLVESR